MSLSDWDLLAFDENAQASDGTIKGFITGTACEIRKNWLYVRDEDAWVGGRRFVKPTIAEVQSGDLYLSGFEIVAVRGPQEAIFVQVTAAQYKKQEKGEPYQPPDVRRMAGIGCCGYYVPFAEVLAEEGLDPREWAEESSGGFGGGGEPEKRLFTFQKLGGDEVRTFERDPDSGYETRWVGVLLATLAAFVAWLKSTGSSDAHNAWVDAIEKAEPLRANQGDRYFARNAGVPLSVTPVGKQQTPVLEQLHESAKKE